MPPEMMTKVMPMARMAMMAIWLATLSRLSRFKKSGHQYSWGYRRGWAGAAEKTSSLHTAADALHRMAAGGFPSPTIAARACRAALGAPWAILTT